MNELDAQRRRNVLVDLIELRVSLSAAVSAVRGLPWDSEAEAAILTRQDAIALLQRVLKGELGPTEVEAWADAVEGRDDIGVEYAHEELLRAFVFEMANPLLTRSLSDSRVKWWLGRLGDAPPPPHA